MFSFSRLQDDITLLSRNHQDLTLEMDDVMRARDDLKRQVEDNMSRISDLEVALSAKVYFIIFIYLFNFCRQQNCSNSQ